jgi:hypothetical protein
MIDLVGSELVLTCCQIESALRICHGEMFGDSARRSR